MIKIEIIVDPTEEIIDNDLKKVDLVVMIHVCKIIEDVQELIDIAKRVPNFQVVYIHYYSKDGTYTIGIKKKW